MNRSAGDPFVRFPTTLLEKLVNTPLNGTQWRILLWVIRQTYGWHRTNCRFTWYRIAKDLSMDRGGVLRAGTRLLKAGILTVEDDHIGIVDTCHREAMTNDIACADNCHRERCLQSALLRRAKDSRKERLERNIKISLKQPADFPNVNATRQHLAQPTTPTAGKYERLSQN
jgi:phage replication O-like protein O